MNFKHNRQFSGVLVIVWMMVMVSMYYAGHKPLDIHHVVNLGQVLWDIFLCFAVISIAGGIGRRIGPRLELNPLTSIALHAALGMGVLSLVFLVAGTAFWIGKFISWSIVLLGVILFWRDALQWWKGWLHLISLWQLSGKFGKFIATGLCLLFFFTLIVSLAPPLKFDALVYHLAIPVEYLNQGKINYLPENMFWGMPQLAEMLYTWIISLSRTETAAVFGWIVGLLVTIGLLGYVVERFNQRSAWAALASLFCSYSLIILLPAAYVDWFAVLYGLCVLVILDIWQDKGKNSYLIWAGIFAAFGVGVKYTAGILVICGLCILLFDFLRNRRNGTQLIRNIALFSVPMIIVSLPWLVKNILATGNPFYPFFLPSGEMDEFRLSFYQLPPWGTWQELLLLPFKATFTGHEGAVGYSASIGPLLIALSPFVYLGYSRKSMEQKVTINTAVIFTVSGIIIWAFTSRFSGYLIQTRLFFVMFPAISILAGIGYENLSEITLPGIRIGRITGALILFVFGLTIFQTVYEVIERNSIVTIVGLSAQSYLEENLGWYYPAMQSINELPSGSNVLMLWEPRGMYCSPVCESDEVLDRWLHDQYLYQEPVVMIDEWKTQGYTHVLVYDLGVEFTKTNDPRYTDEDWQALNDLVEQLHNPHHFGNAYSLYSLDQ